MRKGLKFENRRRDGAVVRVARIVSGETQEALASRLGDTQRNISFYEEGKMETPDNVLRECARIIGLDLL